MLLLLSLAACPAEQLGIELPPGGAESISQEDAQRDLRGLVREGGPFFARRMEQMGFAPESGEGWVCGARGRGPARAIVAPWPDDADAAAAGAALIALAKAWDTLDGPPGATTLCLGAPPADRVGAEPIRVDRLAPGPLEWGPPIRSGTPDPSRPPERFDYRELAGKARELFGRLGGVTAPR